MFDESDPPDGVSKALSAMEAHPTKDWLNAARSLCQGVFAQE